jgi:hypothetical protein
MKRKYLWDSENELATQFSECLRERGLKTYPELRADIVIDHGDALEAVEAKLTANLKVLTQAIQHRSKFQLVSVLIPTTFRDNEYAGFITICRELGLGVWTGKKQIRLDKNVYSFIQVVSPKLRDVPRNPDFDKLLIPEAAKWTTPGKKSPSGFSTYRLKELTLARWFRANPGKTMRDALMDCYPRKHKRSGVQLPPTKNELEIWNYTALVSKFMVVNEDKTISATDLINEFDPKLE